MILLNSQQPQVTFPVIIWTWLSLQNVSLITRALVFTYDTITKADFFCRYTLKSDVGLIEKQDRNSETLSLNVFEFESSR